MSGERASAGEYELAAEFHEVFMLAPWDRLRPSLADAFGALSATDVVLDVGAGSGAGLAALAASTAARIVAIEPSPTMRAMLLARLLERPSLKDRVTIFAGAAPDAIEQLSGPIAGFVCMHMLGHLEAGARAATLRALARRMPPGASGLVTVTPDAAAASATSRLEEASVGQHRYSVEWRGDGTTRYEVRDGGTLVRSLDVASSWTPVTAAAITAAARDAFDARAIDERLVRLTRPPSVRDSAEHHPSRGPRP